MRRFEEMNLKPFILETIKDLHFDIPTPIQTEVMPLIHKKRDVIGISQTGTGKTHAFLIPIMERLNLDENKVQAVITAPTRELAGQIYDHVKLFMKHEPRIKASLVIGGKDKQKAIAKLAVQPQIVIGTPGRIRDLSLNEQALLITTADIFVIDEADMTLDLGYLEDIDAVAGKMKEDLQMLVFSATIPQNLRPFLRKYMHQPQIVEIDAKKVTVDHVEHILVWTRHQDRFTVLLQMIEKLDPYLCLIFCNTRKETSETARKLYDAGMKVGEIHGDLEPRERRSMMRRIKNNEFQYIVATDIAARGIDIDGASHIINMGFPSELDFYIHRSGRTGRGKYTGYCYSLYDTKDEKAIVALENRGITFKNTEIKNGEWKDIGVRERRKNRERQPSEIEQEIQKIVRRPAKVKPGYKKKRQREVQKIVSKQKRAVIQADIRRQKKERARKAQAERSRILRGED